MREETLRRVARRQDGLIGRAQALEVGYTRQQLRRKCAAGSWSEAFPGVYRVDERPMTERARIRAASLWAGAPSWISGIAAAHLWNLWTTVPTQLELIVPRSRCLRPPNGITVHRIELDDFDINERFDIPVTNVNLTALQCAVALGKRGPEMLDRALQTLVLYPALVAAVDRYPRGRWVTPARELLAAAAKGSSDAERLLVDLLQKAGVSGWVLGHPFRGGGISGVIDVAFPDLKLAIEVDGWAWHHQPDRFIRDRRRGNALLLAGWNVLHYTWYDLKHRAAAVLAEIRGALAG